MYDGALAGYEKTLGRDHTSTLCTVVNLGLLYRDQGKLDQAEQMYDRALAGYEVYPSQPRQAHIGMVQAAAKSESKIFSFRMLMPTHNEDEIPMRICPLLDHFP